LKHFESGFYQAVRALKKEPADETIKGGMSGMYLFRYTYALAGFWRVATLPEINVTSSSLM
jgi:hypothetical protein